MVTVIYPQPEELGRQETLSLDGTLTVWQFQIVPQIDLGGCSAREITPAGGSYVDEEGFVFSESTHIAVTLTRSDGIPEVLYGQTDPESRIGFLHYNDSWDDALYDWYVKQNQLDLPLHTLNRHDELPIPEEAGGFPLYDGDGWYPHVPVVAWDAPAQNSAGVWESASQYPSGSAVLIAHSDVSADAQMQQFRDPASHAAYPLTRSDGAGVDSVYLFSAGEDGCIVLHTIYHPELCSPSLPSSPTCCIWWRRASPWRRRLPPPALRTPGNRPDFSLFSQVQPPVAGRYSHLGRQPSCDLLH